MDPTVLNNLLNMFAISGSSVVFFCLSLTNSKFVLVFFVLVCNIS